MTELHVHDLTVWPNYTYITWQYDRTTRTWPDSM